MEQQEALALVRESQAELDAVTVALINAKNGMDIASIDKVIDELERAAALMVTLRRRAKR